MKRDSAKSLLVEEFDRQLATLLRLGYARFTRRSQTALSESLRPLRARVEKLPPAAAEADVPFVIAFEPRLAPPEKCMALVEDGGRPGVVDMNPTHPNDFAAIDEASPPTGAGYLVYGIEAGRDLLNVTPDDALPVILARGRSPLTIQEGIAVLTHVPNLLRASNAYSLLGSRRGDKRVPALWLSKGRPRLGWCWAGNPHTWLGSASCAGRVGA